MPESKYYPEIEEVRGQLLKELEQAENKKDILKSTKLSTLFSMLKNLPEDKKAAFGKQVNDLRNELIGLIDENENQDDLSPIDVTAPMDVNQKDYSSLLPATEGTIHPVMTELDRVIDIFYKMGFRAIESQEIDDDYHMFGSLNFPEDHPARDDYDTFRTAQLDKEGRPFVAPAHTSTMQSRVLKANANGLKEGKPIAYIVPGRVFRNEDLDPRHEHTFYQVEGIYVDKGINVGNLMSTLKDFLSAYYQKDIELKTQPFFFPFTEPSFEFSIACIFCNKAGCSVCSYSGWIELLGCGIIHPNVLHKAGIDHEIYSGFAFGLGFTRMVMIKYGIEDVRYFMSGRLDFLRQFK